MREAERQRDAATEYARAVEEKRQILEKRFVKTDSDYMKKFESNVKIGMEAAQRELSAAIEAGDAKAQVEANKRIATLAFENAKLEEAKSRTVETHLLYLHKLYSHNNRLHKYLKQILMQKLGHQETHGLVKIEP